jgi:hypothetical protein
MGQGADDDDDAMIIIPTQTIEYEGLWDGLVGPHPELRLAHTYR